VPARKQEAFVRRYGGGDEQLVAAVMLMLRDPPSRQGDKVQSTTTDGLRVAEEACPSGKGV